MSLLYKGGKIGMTARVVLNGSGIVIFPVTILDAKQFREKNVEAPVRPNQNAPTFTIPMTTVTVT
jgi:ribosomal protein L3